MHFPALTLRLLLALALILNGIGGAVAGVTGLELAAVASSHAAPPGSDCDGHQDGAGPAADRVHAAPSHPCPGTGDGDCSGDPQCLQACTHACIAVSQRFSIGVQVNAARLAHPFSAGHPSPPTRSLIRPPIA